MRSIESAFQQCWSIETETAGLGDIAGNHQSSTPVTAPLPRVTNVSIMIADKRGCCDIFAHYFFTVRKSFQLKSRTDFYSLGKLVGKQTEERRTSPSLLEREARKDEPSAAACACELGGGPRVVRPPLPSAIDLSPACRWILWPKDPTDMSAVPDARG